VYPKAAVNEYSRNLQEKFKISVAVTTSLERVVAVGSGPGWTPSRWVTGTRARSRRFSARPACPV